MNTEGKLNAGRRSQVDRLRGAGLDTVCPALMFRDEMGIAEEMWTLLVDAGLPLIPAGRVRLVVVSEVVAFLKTNPKLGPRPSEIRKQRFLKRKGKAK